jgi:hypothetical protein
MTTAGTAFSASSTEHAFQSFTAISLKPLLQFVTIECLAAMPTSGLNLVDFVMQLLESNKERLYQMCRGSDSVSMQLQSYPNVPHTISSSQNSKSPKSSQIISPPSAFREVSPSVATRSPAGDGAQSCSKLARDPAPFHKLADAAISSLKRKDKRFMGEVFNRHAKPLGLSAKALTSALHAIDPSSFAAHVSDAASAKKLKEVETSNKGHVDFEEFCQAANMSCAEGDATCAARDAFLRFADVKGLSAEAFLDALKEVDAPVLLSSEGCSPEQLFRRADANTRGSVDFAESDPPLVPVIFRCHAHLFGFRFMRAAELPDDLEMILEDYHLGVRAVLL